MILTRLGSQRHSHLLPAKDQALLHWWYALFLLHALLYAGDLAVVWWVSGCVGEMRCDNLVVGVSGHADLRWGCTYFVVGFDIKLDLLAG